MAPRRSWTFWMIYITVVTLAMTAVLDVAAGVLVRRRLKTMLAIFECILCDGRNVLTPAPGLRRVWDASPAFRVDVRTNARGFREDVDFRDSEVDVAVMGDSFAFGWAVNVEDRFSNVVAAEFPDRRIVSLSYNNGFQPEHYEYFLDRHPDLRPRVLVLALCLTNDLDSDVRETVITRAADGQITELRLPYRALYFGAMRGNATYRLSALDALVRHTNLGALAGTVINQSPGLRQRLRVPETDVPNLVNRLSTELGQLDELGDRTFRALNRINSRVQERGGRLHVLVIPQDYYLGAPPDQLVRDAHGARVPEIVATRGLERAVLQRCAASRLQCHDLSTVLTADDYLHGDGHWRPQGHAKVAAVIRPLVAEALGR